MIVKVTVDVRLQVFGLLAVNVTVYVPGAEYKCVGSKSVDVLLGPLAGSPKFQSQVSPASEVFLNSAVYGRQPDAGVVNFAMTFVATLN